MMAQQKIASQEIASHKAKTQTVKCVVWDLDNTLWDGVLLEEQEVTLRPGVINILKTLDSRGILHSIASRNDYASAMRKLEAFGLQDFFLYPQINWNSKSASLQEIARLLNIGIDTLAFVDDQPFEREEVNFVYPTILCIDAADLLSLPLLPAMIPRFLTEDAKNRRLMYLNDITRTQAEQEFSGSNEAFLATLGMVLTISPAQEEDLRRAEELTMRTHQLNTTGYTYSYEELNSFRQSDHHQLLIAELRDIYGAYGKIGLALIECQQDIWTIKLLLMSCRVISRGIGTIIMSHIMQQAKEAHACLLAEFVPNDRNRMMSITYKFGGFKEVERTSDLIVFQHDLTHIQAFPPYVHVTC